MAASQYEFNIINREYSKFYRAIIGYHLVYGYRISLLFFKKLSKYRSLWGLFLKFLFCVFFKNKGNSLGWCS